MSAGRVTLNIHRPLACWGVDLAQVQNRIARKARDSPLVFVVWPERTSFEQVRLSLYSSEKD